MASTAKKGPTSKANGTTQVANGNGAATIGKGKAKKDSDDPAAATSVGKDVDSKAVDGHVSKPDQAAYQAEQEKLKAEIDDLQTQLNVVKEKIAMSSKDGPAAERRAALRAEQDGLRGQQSNNKMSRTRIQEQLDSIQENIQKKVKDLQAAKSKAPFRSVAEVENAIKNLEKQVESGTMAIAQEKRALLEITQYKRARKTIESFDTEQAAIEAERAKFDELRKQRDDPEFKAISDRYDSIKAELDQIKAESDKAFASRSQLFDQRTALQKDLSSAHERKRESTARYREANDRYWQKVNEDRAKRAERYRAQRAADEEAKRKEIVERLREEAEAPAFESEIQDCQTLIDYFHKMHTGGPGVTPAVPASLTEKSSLAGVPKLELRKVEQDTGMVARKKKGEEEEAYFAGSNKAKAKKNAGGKPLVATDKLNVPLPTLTALLKLSIPPPSAHGELPRVMEDLKTKKTWFEANQKRVTAENIAKVQDKIRALETGSKSAKFADGEQITDQTEDAPTNTETAGTPASAGEQIAAHTEAS